MSLPQSPSLHGLQTEILEALVLGERFETIAQALCKRVEEFAPEAICSILEVTNGKIRPIAAPSLPQEYSEAINGTPIGPSAGSCGTAAFLGEPVEVDDISTSPLWAEFKDLALPLGLMACWSSPIKTRNGRVAATFAFYFKTKRGPTPLEQSIVNTCVHLCSIAIEHEESQKRNHALVYFDQLTGMPNRRSFDDMVFDRLIDDEPAFGILVIDIDNLKIANDTMGHVVGDSLIQEVAGRLKQIIPNGSCRVGGDEFSVIVDGCSSHDDLNPVVDQIAHAMKQPFECGGYTIIPQITMGGVVYGVDGIDTDLLRQNADFALYHAKEIKRGGYVPFEGGLRTSIALRMSTIRAVDQALNEARVMPFYQPIVMLGDSSIHGLEALARIKLESGKIVAAGQFQSALSDPNIAFRLTDQMLKQIASDMRGWLDAGKTVSHVAINLSTADFYRSDLDQRISEAFESVGVPLNHLVLEVTEGVLMGGKEDKVAKLTESLRKKGMLIALDDFGTGFASLTHLIRFPVDVIKIDKSFIDNMLTDRPSRLVVELLIDLSRKLGTKIIAEGVELQAQADRLRDLGCQFGQGYYFGRPSDLATTTALLQGTHGLKETPEQLTQKRLA